MPKQLKAGLESNMGAGEITIFVLRDYVYFSRNKSGHNLCSRNMNRLRMEVNHPETCIFVLPKAQLLAIHLAKDLAETRFFFSGTNDSESLSLCELGE